MADLCAAARPVVVVANKIDSRRRPPLAHDFTARPRRPDAGLRRAGPRHGRPARRARRALRPRTRKGREDVVRLA
jgi:hypothetical protein